MATEVVKIVDPDGGGDYSSLAAWEADFGTCTQSNYPSMSGDGDLEGADLITVADCRCTSGSADTNAVTIDGWTSTGADNYIKIWTDPDQGYRHDGEWNTSAYRLDLGHASLTSKENNTKIIGLQIRNSLNYASTKAAIELYPAAGSAGFEVSYCILCTQTDTYTAYGIRLKYVSGTNTFEANLYNNIIYDFKNSDYGYGIVCDGGSDWTIYSYNNTVVDCNHGYHNSGADDFLAKNCIAQDCTDGFYGTFDSASDFNCSDISGDAPGSNSVTGTVTFVDAANDDYHLDSSDTGAKDYGTDLSSDPNLAFIDDIDGETRSGTWDIGADEYVETGGGTSIEIGSMSLVFVGQSVSTSLDITQEIPKMSLLLTGQSVHHAISVTKEITAAALSWVGKTLGLNYTIHPAKMALSWAGQAVKTSTGVTVEIAKATLSWAGKSVSSNKTFKIAKMTLIWAGKIPGIGGIISWGIHRLGLDLTIEM